MDAAKAGYVQATAGLKFTSLSFGMDEKGKVTIILNGKPIKDLSTFVIRHYEGSYGSTSVEFKTRTQEISPGEFAQEQSFYLVPPDPAKAEASLVHAGEMPESLRGVPGGEVQKLLSEM